MKKTSLALTLALTVAAAACSDDGPAPLEPPPAAEARFGPAATAVTHDGDAGPGSFRAAVEAANADAGITRIRFDRNVGTVVLASTVEFTGSQSLTIEARGAVLDGSAVGDAFASTGGASLSLVDLTVADAGADGIFVPVPAAATGMLRLELRGVTLSGNGEFGLHVDDQTEGSTAGVELVLRDVHILDNGFAPGIDDKDGVRVDEGGPGSVISLIVGTVVTGNAGDGIEYDEKGNGDVVVDIRRTRFDDNGSQPQLPSDLEDGFDIDEAGPGSILADFIGVSASDNRDEGIDLDEEGPGDIVSFMNRVEANGNADENIKFSEDADVDDGVTAPGDSQGGIEFRFQNVTANGSTDDGIQLEEFGNGDVDGEFVGGAASGNGDDGLEVEQLDAGGGLVRVQSSTFEDNADDALNIDGVELVVKP